MITPDSAWYWYIDPDTDHLVVALDKETHFQTAFSQNELRHLPRDNELFSIEQVATFTHFQEQIAQQCHEFTEPQVVQMLFNALAAIYFVRPPGMKSWHFAAASDSTDSVLFANLVSGGNEAPVLVIEHEGTSCTCLLLSSLQLSCSKAVSQFAVLRVATNRLHSRQQNSVQQKSA